AEFHCDSQPVQKGTRDIIFHFCAIVMCLYLCRYHCHCNDVYIGSYNTVIDILVYRRFGRFAKKALVGRVSVPLFQLRRENEDLWIELSDVSSEIVEDNDAPVRILLRYVSII